MQNYFYFNLENIELEQKSNIIVTWNRKPTLEEITKNLYKKNDDVILYYDFTNGKYIDTINNDSKIINMCNKEYAISYKTINDMLNISLYEFYAKKPEFANETRQWNLVKTLFIDKNKNCYIVAPSKDFLNYNNYPNDLKIKKDNELLFISVPPEELNWRAFDISSYKNINFIEDESCDKNLFNILKNMFNEYFIYGNFNVAILNNMENLKTFILTKDNKTTKGNSQKTINELISYETKNIKLPKVKKTNLNEKIATIEKINDKTCCIKIYIPLYEPKLNINKYVEICRLYIKGSKLISCRQSNNNCFVPLRGNLSNDNFKFTLINYKDEIVENTCLKYLTKIMNKFDKSMHGFILWTFIKWPILEKFYNAGFEEFISNLIKYEISNNNLKQELERIFGTLHNKSSMLKCLGINKYQFNKIKNFEDYNFYFSKGYDYKKRTNKGLLNIIKYLLNTNEISSIDNETFNNIFNIATEIYDILKISNNYSIRNNISIILKLLLKVNILYSIKAEITIAPVLMSYKNEENDAWPFSTGALSIFKDYLNMVEKMNNTNDFKPYFKTKEELNIMHDMAVEVYNIMSVQYKKEAFQKVSSRWNKYCYENDKYSVIAPVEPADLAREGFELHHCVKGYIDRVINKETNIVFIRKIEELDKPFFTVEITNDNTIQQIHGMCNRNISTEPDLIPFVNEWVENKKLKISNYDKVR